MYIQNSLNRKILKNNKDFHKHDKQVVTPKYKYITYLNAASLIIHNR